MTSLFEIRMQTIDGGSQTLSDYAGKTMLVVNVASRCGFTPQYRGLEALWRRYRDKGFVVLGFPCDQFGRQEPGDEAEIRKFCSEGYDVTFPLFAKIKVNGADAHPLYKALKSAAPGFLGSFSHRPLTRMWTVAVLAGIMLWNASFLPWISILKLAGLMIGLAALCGPASVVIR